MGLTLKYLWTRSARAGRGRAFSAFVAGTRLLPSAMIPLNTAVLCAERNLFPVSHALLNEHKGALKKKPKHPKRLPVLSRALTAIPFLQPGCPGSAPGSRSSSGSGPRLLRDGQGGGAGAAVLRGAG